MWAWIAGALAFVAPWAAIAANPDPTVAAGDGGQERPVKIIHRITRRVIIRDPVENAGVRYVYVGGGSSSSSSSSGGSTSVSTSSGGGSTSTGGS
jgi:uncharacterized membrane protein YgcG